MKVLAIVFVMTISTSTFAQTKAKSAILPPSAQAADAKKQPKKLETAKSAEAPCDTKEDVLKKLEEKKKESAMAGKGLSLQGATDSGCTLK
ncbi:hypothetical protein DOM21_04175 [Bacteriovorax stolpii]|uniref:hypothetical protein n=1 Tax=Bacteriovorax stolpii TaxID=960 RepID=UPI0011587B8E|nr:hypothetical protein [Bacteriovorax stolpii]QDK40663.1 hypothetical protein DOM21_04175 [Bacteriovorax stolpii]